MQQSVQTDATCNIQQYCVRLHGALEPYENRLEMCIFVQSVKLYS